MNIIPPPPLLLWAEKISSEAAENWSFNLAAHLPGQFSRATTLHFEPIWVHTISESISTLTSECILSLPFPIPFRGRKEKTCLGESRRLDVLERTWKKKLNENNGQCGNLAPCPQLKQKIVKTDKYEHHSPSSTPFVLHQERQTSQNSFNAIRRESVAWLPLQRSREKQKKEGT